MMPSFTPVDYDPFAGRSVPNVGRPLLDAIAGSESPDYNTVYGGGKFDDMSDHPRRAVPIASGPNRGKTSSAAGRYQFLGSTWDEVKKEAGLSDFSPENQDLGAWHLANKTYKQKTGRDLESDLTSAKGNPEAIKGIGGMLSGVWTSLPGGIEPNSMTSSFASRVGGGGLTEISAQSKPQRRLTPVDYDPFAKPDARFTDTAGENFRTAREGVSPTAEPPKGLVDKLVAIWENPPKDKLSLVGMVKAAYEGATLPGDVASGKVPVTGEDGRTSPEVIERSAKLAGTSPLRPAPGGIAAAAIGPRTIEMQPVKAAVPSAQELKTAAQAGFESAPIKELEIAPRAVFEFGQGIAAKLNEAGIDENLAPKTFGVLKKLGGAPDDATVTGGNLQSLRRTFQTAAGSPDKTERMAASKVIDAIDEFIPNVAARDILSGDPKAAAQAWSEARGNYAAAMRSDQIAKALIKAQRQAEAAGSGANIDNATRQQFKAILNSDSRSRGFNAEERAAMESAVRGTTWGNFARLIGKAAPTGIVSGGLAGGAGFAVGGSVGAVLVPLAGYIGKKIGDRSTSKQVQALDELVRSRAPLAKAMEDFGVKFSVIERDGQNARTMSALSLSARNLANNLKDAGINLSPGEIMRALQGPVKSAAEDDQQN